MKRMLLFVSLCISVLAVSSCKKDKSPDYNGPSNVLSGVWSPDYSAVNMIAGTITPEYGFGTDYRYEILSGTVADPRIERGTYSIQEEDNPRRYKLIMKPKSGQQYNIQVTEVKANSAIFNDKNLHTPWLFLRK